MEVATIDHVNVETDDIERSEQFYREVIGLQKGPRPDFDRPGYWMYAGGQPVVHIMKTAPENKMLTGSKDASISHFSLQIKDFESARKHLDSTGVDYETNEVPGTEIRQFFLEDPEGVLIELIHFPNTQRI